MKMQGIAASCAIVMRTISGSAGDVDHRSATKSPLLPALVFAGLALVASVPARAAPPVTPYASTAPVDPCNFSSAFAFDRDQVLACYRSIPFCPPNGDAATCDRAAQVAHFRAAVEGFSDLRSVYDATGHWRRKLDAVERTDFKSDFDFWVAMSDVVSSFKNPHWTYFGPSCFEETLFALIPLEFGSMVTPVAGRDEQIIYLREPAPFFASEYVTATGIDVAPYTGQRVVAINGAPALEFLRKWAREGLHQDTDDGINLMMTLLFEGYTLRTGSFNAFPESRSVTLELEARGGGRTKVELPWAFIPFTEFGFPGPPPSSTEEFRALCFAPAAKASAALQGVVPGRRGPREPVALDERLRKRRAWVNALAAKKPSFASATSTTGYTEVPPELLNKDVTEILPLVNGARTVVYGNHTVAIQLRSDFEQPWEDQLDAGARYACAHADRLIVDLRDNGGGFVSRAERFAHYLNPTPPVVPDAVFGFRELARSPALNELRTLSETLVSLGFDPCTLGYEPACFAKMPSGQPVTEPRWFTNSEYERRGNAIELLTPQVTHRTIIPKQDFAIPCPGRFTGKNLIVLLNGVNGSAAFFAPELLDGIATLVVAGGFANEKMMAGRARGGPVVFTSSFQDDADFLRSATGSQVFLRLPELPRPVQFRIEHDAFYRHGLRHLYIDRPAVGDVHVPFWSTSRATDGAAYRAVISAVERRALVDPSCHRPPETAACADYEQCASATVDRAVRRHIVSADDGARSLADAAKACREGG